MHAIILNNATLEQQIEFIKQIQEKEYRVEYENGREGYVSPHVSVMLPLNIRANKEIMPDVLRDIGAMMPGETRKGTNTDHHLGILGKIIKIGRKILGLKTVKKKTGVRNKIPNKGWNQPIFLFAKEDPQFETKIEGITREVL